MTRMRTLAPVAGLLEGRDPLGRLIGMESMPVGEELALVERRPLDHERQGPRRKHPVQHTNRRDAELRLGARVRGVKVRRIVIVKVHADHNAEEPASRAWSNLLRHLASHGIGSACSMIRRPGGSPSQ